MYSRYYIESFFHHWVIKDMENASTVFGPFESETDCYFIMQMINNGKIKLVEDGQYGEEGIKEPHSVY